MYNYWGAEQIWACVNRYDQSAHILQAQVCGCISAHAGLPYQKKTIQETSDGSKVANSSKLK